MYRIPGHLQERFSKRVLTLHNSPLYIIIMQDKRQVNSALVQLDQYMIENSLEKTTDIKLN